MIEIYPLSGRIISESNDKSIREIIKGNYRVIYQIRNKNAAFILTVFHTSRLLSEKDLKYSVA